MTTAVRGRGHPEMVSIRATEVDELQMEIRSLRFDSREDALHMTDPAKRLRESAIRDGRFSDFQDSSLILARVARIARRGGE